MDQLQKAQILNRIIVGKMPINCWTFDNSQLPAECCSRDSCNGCGGGCGGRCRHKEQSRISTYIYVKVTVPSVQIQAQLFSKVGTQIILLVLESQFRKFLGSFRNRKSANFWGVLVRESQIRKFVMINPQITNPQIYLVSQPANRKSAKLQGKKQCFWSRVRIWKPFKEPRNRFLAWRNRFIGIDSWAP